LVLGGVFGDGGSNGAISGWIKLKRPYLLNALSDSFYVWTLTILPSHSIITVGAYDRRLDTYFVRKGIKRKNKKAGLEKIYTLDWLVVTRLQSKAFLVKI